MTQTTATRIFVYVGSYTRKGADGIGIYSFDPVTGALTPAGGVKADNASFLAIHPSKRFLYAVNEIGSHEGQPTGAVSAFAIDRETGALTLLNQQPSHGIAPCHVTVSPDGKHVYVANYGTGTASVYPVDANGRLGAASDTGQHAGSGPDSSRQKGPHAHSVNLDPSGRVLYVADLGLDRLMMYDVATDPGTLTPNRPPYAEVAGGSGPRHFTFHPSGAYAYVINEMGNTITAFAHDPQSGALTAIQTVPSLPEGFAGNNTTADIHVHPAGGFLYGSNRGHDSIVVYAIDGETGVLTYIEHVSTQGRTPRNFAIDPTGTYLVAANQDSDNLVVFRINPQTGTLTPAGQQVQVSMPVCVKFYVP